LFGAVVKGRPVMAAMRSATFGEADRGVQAGADGGAAWASSISIGRVCSMRLMPFSTCWA
jgi:hypothetical protein